METQERDPFLESLETPGRRAAFEAERAWIREQFGAPPDAPIKLEERRSGVITDADGRIICRLGAGSDGLTALRITVGGRALLVPLLNVLLDDEDYDVWDHVRREIEGAGPDLRKGPV